MALSVQQVTEVKAKGFLRNRGTDLFSGRIVAPGTVFTAQNMEDMAEIARTFGNGTAVPTSRQTMELPGIPYERIGEAIAFAEAHGLRFGGTGAKIRPVTVCKGTTCVYGNYDTQALGKKIDELYYVGRHADALPHKFKIAVGGCPNSCIKPSLNDFGIEGRKTPRYDAEQCRGCKTCAVEKSCPMRCAKLEGGKLRIDWDVCLSCGVCVGKCPFGAVAHESETAYQIYVGGTWGKRSRMGTPLKRFVKEEEILPLLDKAIDWFRENAQPKERFGMAIDRVGLESLEKALGLDS